MRLVRAFLVVLACVFAGKAQDATTPPAAFVAPAQDWMEENLDDWVFDAAGLDREAVSQFLVEAQSELQLSTAESNTQAATDTQEFLDSLDQYEGAKPYTDWLKSLLNAQVRKTPTDPQPLKSSSDNAIETSPDQPTTHERRERWIRILSKRPESRLALKYAAELKPIFLDEGVPAELVWLAEVESAFNPIARSPAGAVGLFQLMPDTARSLDLSLWPFDQRKQPLKNARAAARYLRHLHDRFDDWELALAAYNGGETRVAQLLSKREARTYDAIADRLPGETQDYVPKVEAMIWVREGVDLSDLVTAQK